MDKAKYLTNWKWISERISNFLIPFEIEPEERSKRIFTGLVCIITIPIALIFSFIRFNAADYLLGAFLFLIGIVVTFSLIIGRNFKDTTRVYRFNMAFVGLLFLYLIGVSGLHPRYVLWAFIYPMEAFYLLGLRAGGLFTSVFYIIAVCLILFQDLIHGSIHYDNHFKMDFLFALLAVSLIAYFFEKVKRGYELGLKQRQIILEEERTELKEARDQLFEAGEKLENKISERTEELTKANIQLKQDIQDRLRYEEALRKSEEKYRDLFKNVSDLLYFHDLDGNLIETNFAWKSEYGFTEEDLDHLNIRDLMPERYRNQFNEYLKRVKENGKDEGLLRVIKKDGREVIVEYRNSLVHGPTGPIGVSGSGRDITSRTLAEEALRESEENYRLHFENSSDAIYTINRNLEIEMVSPSAVNILGFSAEELAGKSISDVQVLAPGYQEKAISEIMRVLGGERILASEYEFMARDGKRVFGEVSGSPLIKNGEVVGMISVARDITDRKMAEEERTGLEKRLMKAQKMEAIGTLAGGIAHDFNNLLMGIQGRASLILLDIESSHPHFEHLKGIEAYVNSAADLTKQLLGFARGGKYELKPIDLNDLIKVSSQMFGRAKKEIRIHTKLQPDLWTIEADEKQIEQVLLNLYINAWQAMLEGGELYLQTENIRLTEDYAYTHQVKPGKYVKISVTDTGVGMDEATKQKIFDPFFTTKEMGRGTGLGLASAYGIVKNHDGIIDVYSEKGHGTTFVINLPASEREATRKEDSSGELLKGAGTILLVDDEELILDVGKPILEKLGYKVMVAKGGQEALDLYRQKPDQIDMVILDMIMPDKSGGETYDGLKEINPDVKVILSSGYSEDGQAKNILSRGCNGFMQKPFTIKTLSQKIREIMDKN